MGWTYNNPDAPTEGPMITAVATTLTILSLMAVSARLYVRLRMVRATGYEDWIIVATWFATAGFTIITSVQTKWGLGLLNKDDLPLENLFNFGLLQYMGAPFYISSILGFKLALLISYLRFLPKGAYRIATIMVIVACCLFHLCFLLVQVNLCQPAAKQWDPKITGGSCLKGVPVYTSMASLTIIFDILIMVLPFPVLVQSHIQTRKKFVLLGLFGLGIFITIIQIIRIQTVKRLVDPVDSAPLILWSAVENNLGIIVATIPTLAPLFRYFNDRTRYVVSGGASKKTGATGYASRATGDVGSRYTRQTWRSSRSKRDIYPISDIDKTEMGSFSGKQDSNEFILSGIMSNDTTRELGKRIENTITSNPPTPPLPVVLGGGITKLTEITVTRE